MSAPILIPHLDVSLVDDSDQSVLWIGGGQQTLDLELANTSTDRFDLGAETRIDVTFRPGTLEPNSRATVATDGWIGRLVAGRRVLQTLTIQPTGRVMLEPGTVLRIRLAGLVPSAAGGSRSTRVDVRYRDVHVAGEGPVHGRRVVRLAVLRTMDAASPGPGLIGGPITATVVGSGEIVTGGANSIVVDLAVAADRTIPVTPNSGGAIDDTVSRLTITMPEVAGDKIDVSVESGDGWVATDDGVVRYESSTPRQLSGTFARLRIGITTSREPTMLPLGLRYENFGVHDGELELLLPVTAIGVNGSERLRASRVLQPDHGVRIPNGFDLAPTPGKDRFGVRWTNLDPAQDGNAIRGIRLRTRENEGGQSKLFTAIEIWPDQRKINVLGPLSVRKGLSVDGGTLTAKGNANVSGRLGVGATGKAVRVADGRLTADIGVRVPLGLDINPTTDRDRFGVRWAHVDPTQDGITLRGIRLRTRNNVAGKSELNKAFEIWPSGDANFLYGLSVYGEFHNGSDVRLKRDIADVENALDAISRLRGVRYRNADRDDSPERFGFVAQEVEAVMPDLVTSGPDGLLTVRMIELLAPLVEAVKELRRRIDDLADASRRGEGVT